MPQGGIDEGESPLEAAKRELYEETNVEFGKPLRRGAAMAAATTSRAGAWAVARALSRPDPEMVPVPHSRDWKRKSTSTARPKASTPPNSGTGAGSNGRRLPELVVPFKRDVYVQIVDFFAPIARALKG